MNWSTVITDLLDQPCLDQNGHQLTVRDVATTALIANLPNDEKLGVRGKLELFELAKKVAITESGLLTQETINTIMQRVAAFMPPVVVGRMLENLQGAE